MEKGAREETSDGDYKSAVVLEDAPRLPRLYLGLHTNHTGFS